MRRRKWRLPFTLLILLVLAVSCKTTEDPTLFDKSNLPGMIYDGDNRPCDRVKLKTFRVTDQGEELLFTVETDINGRFTLPGLVRGDYRIEAEKKGYEILNANISYASRTQVLYLKMYSQEQILAMASDTLEKGRFGQTEALLKRSAAIDGKDPKHLYTEAVYLFRTGDFQGALNPLQSILSSGQNFPWVYLLMGDIYQYHLNDREKALDALKEFSRQVEDNDVKARIKELEKQ